MADSRQNSKGLRVVPKKKVIDIREITERVRNEIRIDNDGFVTFSVIGASRIIDVDNSSLGKSFKSALGDNPSELAKWLMQQGLEPWEIAGWCENGIPDMGLALLAEYYGYECPHAYRKEQARVFSRSFKAHGIRNWAHDILGWKKDLPTQTGISQEQLDRIEKDVRELGSLGAVAQQYMTLKDTAIVHHPGLSDMMDMMLHPSYQKALPSSDKISIKEFLQMKNIVLSRKALHCFANTAAFGKRPLSYCEAVKQGRVNVYSWADIPILEAALKSTLEKFSQE